jgi:hypothetical protein
MHNVNKIRATAVSLIPADLPKVQDKKVLEKFPLKLNQNPFL